MLEYKSFKQMLVNNKQRFDECKVGNMNVIRVIQGKESACFFFDYKSGLHKETSFNVDGKWNAYSIKI